ncbi:MAG: phosphate--AMP phosphotransferase, partial [Candidatus Sumerlaeia bacterium]|nr:phosphate--AMP phosphotransferase [Candidatus Sumerlaeia bacterium]
MLEQVDLTPALKKSEAKARLAELAPHLRRLQHDLWQAGVPLIAVFEGWDCAGKGECISLLAELLDPRGFRVHVTFEPTPEEAMRPFLWRFWTKTPAKGQIALFDRSWYQRVLTDRVDGTVKRKVWRRAFHEIPEFEHTLTANGTALLKFWLHISKREQRRRFETFEADPHERWRVRPADWRHHRRYGDFLAATEEMILRTDAATAPWTIIPAENLAFGKVLVVESLLEGMESALRHAKRAKAAAPSQSRPRPPRAVRRVKRSEPTILDRV